MTKQEEALAALEELAGMAETATEFDEREFGRLTAAVRAALTSTPSAGGAVESAGISVDAATWSSRLLNKVIDHVHLTGIDYVMALDETEQRDAAIKLEAERALVNSVNDRAVVLNEDPRYPFWPDALAAAWDELLRAKCAQADTKEIG